MFPLDWSFIYMLQSCTNSNYILLNQICKNVVKIDALPQTQRNEGSGAFVPRIRQVIILNQYQGNTEQRNST